MDQFIDMNEDSFGRHDTGTPCPPYRPRMQECVVTQPSPPSYRQAISSFNEDIAQVSNEEGKETPQSQGQWLRWIKRVADTFKPAPAPVG